MRRINCSVERDEVVESDREPRADELLPLNIRLVRTREDWKLAEYCVKHKVKKQRYEKKLLTLFNVVVFLDCKIVKVNYKSILCGPLRPEIASERNLRK